MVSIEAVGVFIARRIAYEDWVVGLDILRADIPINCEIRSVQPQSDRSTHFPFELLAKALALHHRTFP